MIIDRHDKYNGPDWKLFDIKIETDRTTLTMGTSTWAHQHESTHVIVDSKWLDLRACLSRRYRTLHAEARLVLHYTR